MFPRDQHPQDMGRGRGRMERRQEGSRPPKPILGQSQAEGLGWGSGVRERGSQAAHITYVPAVALDLTFLSLSLLIYELGKQ